MEVVNPTPLPFPLASCPAAVQHDLMYPCGVHVGNRIASAPVWEMMTKVWAFCPGRRHAVLIRSRARGVSH